MPTTGYALKQDSDLTTAGDVYAWNDATIGITNTLTYEPDAWRSSVSKPMDIDDITDKTVDMIFEKLKPKIEKLIDDFFGHLILK